jgi:hypothetical protein
MKKVIVYALGILGVLVLFAFEIASIYYIMPFPGSQRDESVELAYYLHHHLFYFRLLGLALVAYPAYVLIAAGSTAQRTIVGTVAVVYGMVYYQVQNKMRADQMFLQPTQVVFAGADQNKVDRKKLVLGVELNGVARAYPIEIIGYHHQVRDTLGGQSILVTYCTVCRTGRVYRPEVEGKPEEFRLVGMDHFNAMFEDSQTKSWWRQATGEAVVGPRKGMLLEEIPAQQMRLLAWIDRYPNTRILQPDSTFKDAYAELELFDEGTIESGLEKRDSLSWQEKSWVVGIQQGQQSKAYDWNELLAQRVINDRVGERPVLLTLEPDSVSFHAWHRDSLTFRWEQNQLTDTNTNSKWNWRGQCIEGTLKNAQLQFVPAYQEFWHSWRTFHPTTEKFPASD